MKRTERRLEDLEERLSVAEEYLEVVDHRERATASYGMATGRSLFWLEIYVCILVWILVYKFWRIG